jgi:hypothetical protein
VNFKTLSIAVSGFRGLKYICGYFEFKDIRNKNIKALLVNTKYMMCKFILCLYQAELHYNAQASWAAASPLASALQYLYNPLKFR